MIAGGATLGVVCGVLAVSLPVHGGPVAGGTASRSRSTSTVVSPTASTASTAATARPTTPTPTSTGTPSSPGPTATSPTTSPPTSPAAPSVVSQVGPGNLLGRDDFSAAGWDTSSLDIQVAPGEGQDLVGYCQQSDLGRLPGAGAPVRGNYTGRFTSASEVAATFHTPQEADAAYETVRGWLWDCRTGAYSPSAAPATIGPEVRVGLGGTHDTGVWSTIAFGTSGGVIGVVLVAERVAILQLRDPDPKAATVDRFMTSTATRLSAPSGGH